jgi:CII-binding regulator of phage lambda lysogenization HflD
MFVVFAHAPIWVLTANLTKGQTQLINALWQSFNLEFKADADDIQRHGDSVKEELALAKAQADHREQELQQMERELASVHRRNLSSLIPRIRDGIKTMMESQLQEELRYSSKCYWFQHKSYVHNF